jgi:hypothetical protein
MHATSGVPSLRYVREEAPLPLEAGLWVNQIGASALARTHHKKERFGQQENQESEGANRGNSRAQAASRRIQALWPLAGAQPEGATPPSFSNARLSPPRLRSFAGPLFAVPWISSPLPAVPLHDRHHLSAVNGECYCP